MNVNKPYKWLSKRPLQGLIKQREKTCATTPRPANTRPHQAYHGKSRIHRNIYAAKQWAEVTYMTCMVWLSTHNVIVDNYIMRTNELIDYLVRRSYDKTFLKTQIQRASDVFRTDALKNKPRTQTEINPFVITYNPALPNIARIVHQHSNVLYSWDRCRNVFSSLSPM